MLELLMVSLCFVFVSPFFGVCLSIFFDFFLSSYPVLLLPPRNYVLVVLLFALVVSLLGRPKALNLAKKERQVFLSSIVLIILGLFLKSIYQVGISAFAGRVIAPFLLMCAAVYFVNTHKRFLVYVRCLGLAIASVSVIGMFQFLSYDWAWNLHALLNPFVGEGLASPDIYARTRIPGLSPYSVPFSYALCAFSPLFFALSTTPHLRRPELWFYRAVAVFSGIAVLLTLSRSAILGLSIGVVYLAVGVKYTKRKLMGAFVCIAVLLAISQIPAVHNRVQQNNEDERGTLARTVLGVAIAVQNPFGTGGASELFHESAEENIGLINEYQGAQAHNITSAHNQFINTLIYYGFPGLILLIFFYYCVFQLIRSVKSSSNSSWTSGCAIGIEASFIAYVIHSMFHNAGPFIGEIFIWYLVAALLVLSRINRLCPKSA